MKKSELRQMVREEIQALNESDTKYEIKASYKSGKKQKLQILYHGTDRPKKPLKQRRLGY